MESMERLRYMTYNRFPTEPLPVEAASLTALLDIAEAAGRVVAEHQYVDPWIGDIAASLARLKGGE